MNVLWVIHANLPPFDSSLIGVDSVFYSDIGVNVNASGAAVKNASERWWGEDWPNPPRSGEEGRNKRLELQALRFHNYEETPRSILDRGEGREDREFILYPLAMSLAEALTLISDERINGAII